MSFNIRFDNPHDGDHQWSHRRDPLTHLVRSYDPMILGTQEGREPQLRDLKTLLPNLEMVDKHRDWIEERMYPTLYINPDYLKVIDSFDIWLSETPDIAGSSSFDSAFPRLSTVAQVELIDRRRFIITNVHLDHVNPHTRKEQIRVLTEELSKKFGHKFPLIILGDFNEGPSFDVRSHLNKTYPWLNDPWHELKKIEEGSHHKFDGKNEKAKRIDWVLGHNDFVSQNVIMDKSAPKGIWPSDHFPIIADFSY